MSNFVNLLDIIYPVGSLYFSISDVSPADSVGGTWEQIKDTVLAASGDSYSTTANTFGGNKAITVNQMPAHQHDMNYSLSGNNLSIPSNTGNWYVFTSQFGWICPNNPVRATGGGRTIFHTIIQSMYGNVLPKLFEGVGL